MHLRSYQPDDAAAVARLIARRTRHDGRPALSEHKAVRRGAAGSAEVVLLDPELAGYAQVATHPAPVPGTPARSEVEVVVDPEGPPSVERSRVRALIERSLQLPGAGVRTVWAWRPADVAAVADLGLVLVRTLVEMRRSLPLARTWAPPPGVEIRPFRPGVDEDAWLAVNNAAFAGHPENGALDRENLAVRTAQPWFDPDGFLMAWEGERLLGFCWTKLHDEHLGEIYIVGVAPEAQGRGLGSVLAIAALDDLATRQRATTVHLYVEGANHGAVAFYEALGFTANVTLGEYTADVAVQ